MKRLFALFFTLGLVALCGAVGAPIGDIVRGVCVTCFAVGLVASMVGGTRVAAEAFAAALALLVTSIGVDWLGTGTRAVFSHWQAWAAIGGLGCVSLGIGATVLVARAVFVTVPRPQVPRMPRQSRTPFAEPLDENPPWGEDNPTRSRREDRDPDETGVFGGGRRQP